MHTTTRLGLQVPDSSDNESAFPAVSSQQMTTLDNAAIYQEGTLVSRSIGEHGEFFRTTDSGAETVSVTNGTLWYPVALVPASKSSSASAVSGQAIITTGSSAITITLPSHAAGQMVSVTNNSTGGTTVSGSNIQGLGLSSASSFPLGAVGSFTVLIDDGTNWQIIAGQQDSGWQALSIGANVAAQSGYTPAARLQGDRVFLCGALAASSNVSGGATWATVPSGLRPASTSWPSGLSIATEGELTTSGTLIAASTATTGQTWNLDGVTFRLI